MKAISSGMVFVWTVLLMYVASTDGTPINEARDVGVSGGKHLDMAKLRAEFKEFQRQQKHDSKHKSGSETKPKLLGENGHGQAPADYPYPDSDGKTSTAPFGSDGGPCGSNGDCVTTASCIDKVCRQPVDESTGTSEEVKANEKTVGTQTDATVSDDDGYAVGTTSVLHVTKSGYIAALIVTMSLVASIILGLICCWFAGYRGCARAGSGGCGCRLRTIYSKDPYSKIKSAAASQQNLLEMAHARDLDEAAECVLDLAGVNAEDDSLQPVALGPVHMTWSSQSTLASEPDQVDLSVMPDDTDDDTDDERRQFVSRRFSAY